MTDQTPAAEEPQEMPEGVSDVAEEQAESGAEAAEGEDQEEG